MNDEKLKIKLIENCLEKRLSRFEADNILKSHGFQKLEGGEADCYDVLINSTKSLTNPRERVIAASLMRGLSKTEANIALYEAKFRRLNETESSNYDDVLSRIRYCGKDFFVKDTVLQQNPQRIPVDQIITNGILSENSVDELNQTLIKNGYKELTSDEENDYKKRYNTYHNKRQSIIQHAFEDLKTVPEINKLLQENNFNVLSMVEEFKYQKERDFIFSKKRANLIKECLEERFEIYEINIVLNKNGFEELSVQEIDKINSEKLLNKKEKKKTTELSEQFRNLYRKATKQFHPDRYSIPEDKSLANAIMKELNEAKEKNDYFLLKDIVYKYENKLNNK